jgi:hypothetical protein
VVRIADDDKRMKIFELTFDGELPRNMINEFGESLTIKERIQNKSYGLGHLRLKEGNESLTTFYEQENNTIKTHFDWTKKGAVIRMRTMQKVFAIGLKDDRIQNIGLTKTEDYIYAIPLTPFWILMKLGVKPSVAKWFALRSEKFRFGPAYIDIRLTDNEKLLYEVPGDLWPDCLSTFGTKKIKDRVRVVDKRRTTSNSN